MKKRSLLFVILTALVCGAVMALVDGVLKPGYAVKSVIKIALFSLLPLAVSVLDKKIVYLPLLRPKKKGILPALLLGIGIYGLILGAYFLVSPIFDFSEIAGSLTRDVGVTAENFLWVSLYISLVNSFLEEFFFRGFVFTNLKKASGRGFAYAFSALIFAFYHVAMMIGWFSPLLFILVVLGLAAGGVIFNFLNEKMDTIYCSWLTHMFANFAINTIGFILLG